ncbi:glycosyltransferase [Polynucleobacter necessarius]|uniref:glycosyltransferase n=1 Tax=Polynucleobacter necessarius TaxID=576610 RepID=UPI000E097144|nr:glycosyltransferase [Polynucleobacter necessarius]
MKILLVTDIPPCKNFTAGLVLDRLVSFLPKKKIAICAVINSTLHPEIPIELNDIPKLILVKPKESGFSGLAFGLHRPLNILNEVLRGVRVRFLILPKIIAFARAQKIEAIWIVLQGQTMVRIANPLANKLSLPMFTQVWDPLGWWLRENFVTGLMERHFLSLYAKAIRSSRCCATASLAMSELYSSEYLVGTQAVIAGLPARYSQGSQFTLNGNAKFLIGMAGQFYSTEEWNSLIAALDAANWVISGKEIWVRVLGPGFQSFTQSPKNIEYLGWRSQIETVKSLRDCDLLYIPYWFSDKFKEEAKNSFPSKLVTYLCAGRAVFCHAPIYASPSIYLSENEAGYLCHSLDPKEIIRKIAGVIEDPDRYAKISENGSTCFHRDFTLESMKKSFNDFLGIKELN